MTRRLIRGAGSTATSKTRGDTVFTSIESGGASRVSNSRTTFLRSIKESTTPRRAKRSSRSETWRFPLVVIMISLARRSMCQGFAIVTNRAPIQRSRQTISLLQQQSSSFAFSRNHDPYVSDPRIGLVGSRPSVSARSMTVALGAVGKSGRYQPGSPKKRDAHSYRSFSDKQDNWKVPSVKTVEIPLDRIDFSFVRSSGSGGQNVNKVNSQVQVKFLVASMAGWKNVPYEVVQRFQQQQKHRINREGYFVLSVQEYRTQVQNRQAAILKLKEFLVQAWVRPKQRNMRPAGSVSAAGKRRRKEDKKRRSLVKQSRGKVDF